MAAQPKKKTSKVRSKTRRANQRATLPTLVLCAKCKTPKLPHMICPECGYYGRAKLISTKLDEKISKTLDKKEKKTSAPTEAIKPKKTTTPAEGIKPDKATKPKTTKKIIQTPKHTGEEYQEDQP